MLEIKGPTGNNTNIEVITAITLPPMPPTTVSARLSHAGGGEDGEDGEGGEKVAADGSITKCYEWLSWFGGGLVTTATAAVSNVIPYWLYNKGYICSDYVTNPSFICEPISNKPDTIFGTNAGVVTITGSIVASLVMGAGAMWAVKKLCIKYDDYTKKNALLTDRLHVEPSKSLNFKHSIISRDRSQYGKQDIEMNILKSDDNTQPLMPS